MKGVTNSVHSLLNRIGPKKQSRGHNEKEGKDTFYQKESDEHQADHKDESKREEKENESLLITPNLDELKIICEELNKESYYIEKNLTFRLKEEESKIIIADSKGKTIQTLSYSQLIRIKKQIELKSPQKGSLLNISC